MMLSTLQYTDRMVNISSLLLVFRYNSQGQIVFPFFFFYLFPSGGWGSQGDASMGML